MITTKVKDTQLFDIKTLLDYLNLCVLIFKEKSQPHILTQLNSAFQALICFTILEDTLMKGNAPRKRRRL